MTVAIIAFTAQGVKLGRSIANQLPQAVSLSVPPRLAEELGEQPYLSLENWVESHWNQGGGLIFIGATGIAVRAIAHHVRDKFLDPAVISLDEQGGYVIPLLSGHVGGGNALALKIAQLTGGQAVISTATDINQIFAVDIWAKEQNLAIGDRIVAKEISSALLEGKEVGYASDCGYSCPQGLENQNFDLDFGVWVSNRPAASPFEKTLNLVPKNLILGIGCRRGTAQEAIEVAVEEALGEYSLTAISQIASIDLKQDEAGLIAFCESKNLSLTTYSAEELNGVAGEFTPSDFVQSITGVDNVCERAAVLSGGRLLVPKQSKNGVTVAVAERISK